MLPSNEVVSFEGSVYFGENRNYQMVLVVTLVTLSKIYCMKWRGHSQYSESNN